MATEYLPFFEVKEVKEDGSFTGVASVYGVEDLGGDVIDKGAFKKTISENPVVPILWQHKSEEVVGQGTVKEWQNKLLLEAQLDLEDTTAQKAYRKLKNGLIKGLSIGFQTIKSAFEEVEGRSVRHITELKLWEVSIVTFPMLPAAQVTRVKSAEEAREVIADLHKQFPALGATQAVTPREPTQAEEPKEVNGEPEVIHSALSLLDSIVQDTKEKTNERA